MNLVLIYEILYKNNLFMWSILFKNSLFMMSFILLYSSKDDYSKYKKGELVTQEAKNRYKKL